MRFIFDGASEAAAGLELGISAHTVHTYVQRRYRKLGVHDRPGSLIRVFGACFSLDFGRTVGRPTSRRNATARMRRRAPYSGGA